MKKRVRNFERLYEKLFTDTLAESDPDIYLKLSTREAQIPLRLKVEDISEIKEIQSEGTICSLFLRCITLQDCNDIMIDMQDNLPEEVFHVLIDYEGDHPADHPIDIMFCLAEGTDSERLIKVFEFIELYYDSKFRMIYELEYYQEFPTLAHHIIGNDRGGKQHILNALAHFWYTKKDIDLTYLDDIESDYYD